MAGNMPQMAGMMQPQQRQPLHPSQITQIVFKNLAEQPPIVTGWQSGLSIQERLGKTCQLVTQFRMAMQNDLHTAKCIELGLTCERRALLEAPDRNAYEQLIQSKMAELQNKRLQGQHHMQNNVNQQAAFMHQQQQHQKQQQQQRMMQNAAHAAAQAQMNGGMGPNSQLPFQHLQHQMQASPIPQQSSPPMQMGMGGMGGIANQANMPMGAGVQDNGMTMADKQKILEVAKQNYAQAPEHTKQQIRLQMAAKMTPQQQNDFRSKGIDPVLHWFQNQAINQFRRSKMMAQQGLSGMPNQGMVNMQPQRPGAVNGLAQAGPQGVGNHMSPFNMESMMSEQKNAFMAQEAGQTVVPATSQNRHGNPQPGPNMQGQGMSNLQQTPNQPQRPQQPFGMQQANPHLQAQLRAQALAQAGKQAGLPGQPGGGPGGPPMTSQSPAMGTLNTPMANPPVSMGQMNVQAAPNGVPQLDPRFMPRTPISMGGNVNNHMNPQVMLLLQRMTPEQRAQIQGLAPEQLNKLTAKWIESGSANMVGPQPGQLNNPAMENRNPGPNPTLGMPGPPMPPQMGKMSHAQVVEYMDNMELPPQITRALPSLTIPVEIKTYKALKDWLQHTQLMQQYEPTVKQMQIMQFKAEMSKRIQQGQQPLQANQQGLPHQQQMAARAPQQPQNAGQGMGMPQPGPPPQGNAAPPNNQQQMLLELARNLPQHIIQPSPQDIETLRKQPRCAGFTDEQLFDLGRQIKAKNYLMRQQQQRNQQQQQQQQQQRQAQQPQPNMPQPPQSHVGQPLAQPPHELNQNAAQKQPPAPSGAAPPTNEKQSPAMPAPTPTMMNRTQSQSRAPQNAAQRRNLKRSSPDDVIDVTGPTPPPTRQPQPPQQQQPKQQVPQNQAQNQQRPAVPGPARPPSQQLTQEQLSKLSPENRAKYEAALRNRQVFLSVPPEVRERIQKMATEIGHEVAQVVQRDIDIPATEIAQLRQKIPFLFAQLQKAMKGFPQWYNFHGDEQRARLFIRYRHLVMHQFEDGNNASQLKQQLSVRLNDIEQALALVEVMTREMNALFSGAANARGPAAQQPNKPQPQAPRPQAAPEENLEANKAQAKPANKATQGPAGPAAQQPQYPGFGSLPKNTAVPAYLGKPAVTVDTLNPPPPKRKKPNSAQVSSPALQSAHGSPPQTKPPSPEARREHVAEAPKQPPRPLILCTEPGCDAAATGFPSEEARNLHVQEEHVRPSQDPFKYLNESFAFAEAADQQKKLSAAAPAYHSQPQQSVAMQLTQSKDGSMATPTPGAVPMNRQASGVTGPHAPKPGQGMMGGTQQGATPASSTAQDMVLSQPPPSAEENLFTGTVVPNEIFSGVPNFSATADGVISDPSLYRTHTPNDTPDSKDGSTSEPNSDIPDNANIEIDMAWAALDDDFLVNLNNFSVENTEVMDTSTSFMDWNDVTTDFDKPFSFDGSNYILEAN